MNKRNMQIKIGTLVSILVLVSMIWFGKEGYRAAIAYESLTGTIAKQMDAAGLAKLKLKELASIFTLGMVKNDTKEYLLDLEEKRHATDKRAQQNIVYFSVGVVVLLLLYFLLPLRGFVVSVSVGALIALINGLVTPIMLMIVHKQVEYLGDVVLSFESRGILGSISKLYDENNIVVALAVLVFSVIVPLTKSISLLLVAIYEYSPFASKVVRFFRHLGKWSMLDVFIISILLVYMTSNNHDISKAEVEIGLYFFLSYVILSMVASLAADRMLRSANDS